MDQGEDGFAILVQARRGLADGWPLAVKSERRSEGSSERSSRQGQILYPAVLLHLRIRNRFRIFVDQARRHASAFELRQPFGRIPRPERAFQDFGELGLVLRAIP